MDTEEDGTIVALFVGSHELADLCFRIYRGAGGAGGGAYRGENH